MAWMRPGDQADRLAEQQLTSIALVSARLAGLTSAKLHGINMTGANSSDAAWVPHFTTRGHAGDLAALGEHRRKRASDCGCAGAFRPG